MSPRTTTKRDDGFHDSRRFRQGPNSGSYSFMRQGIAPRYNRKGKLMDALAVVLLLLVSGFLGVCVFLLSVPR
jgi:hypothetical protein